MPLFKSKAAKKGETATATAVTTPHHFLTPEKILLAQSPVFGGGKNESFHKFLNHIQMQTTDESNAVKLEFMLLRLYGKAADAFIQLVTQNSSISFDEVIKQMKARFPEPHTVTLQMLRRRKQMQHESLEDFANSIKELVNKFFTSSRGYNKQARDFQMVKFFLFNVGSPLKQQLKKSQRSYQDLNDVLLKSIELQQINQNRQVPQVTQQMSQLHLNQQMTQPQNPQLFSREQQSIKPQSCSSQQMHHRQLGSNASREHQWQQRQPWQRENKNWQGRQF